MAQVKVPANFQGQSSYLRTVSLQFCGRKRHTFVEKWVFAIVKLESKEIKFKELLKKSSKITCDFQTSLK